MKKYFITGLAILLPLALTLAIVVFFVNLLTGPFVGMVSAFFDHYGWVGSYSSLLSYKQVQLLLSRLLILVLLFGFTLLLGWFARWVFFHYLIRLWDGLFHRIPFIRAIYRTSQDVVKTIFTTDTKSFKQVVMVPFPHAKSQSIGLITSEDLPDYTKTNGESLVAVFVPTTPNPTSGFLMLFDPQDITYLDMRVEDAFKFIISCGVIQSSSEEELKRAARKNLLLADEEASR